MRKLILAGALAGAVAALGLATALAVENHPQPTAQPRALPAAADVEWGLARNYPGDAGLQSDSSVVFFEDFENSTVADLAQRWSTVNNKDGKVLSFVAGGPPGGTGAQSLQMTGTKGLNNGGYLYKTLDPGCDQLYVRFYAKFAPDAPYVHHFVQLGNEFNPPPYPMGFAGSRPNGFDHFTTALDLETNNYEAAPPGAWVLYSYWPEMHSWQTDNGEPDGRPNPYYGNVFGLLQPVQAPRGEWICLELMIKCNSAPDKRDGEEAFWVNGRLIDRWATGTHTGTWFRDKFRLDGVFNTDPKPFEGFIWRKTDALKVNYLWLQYYLEGVYDLRPKDPTITVNGQVARVEFDNVVLATQYIGPIATAADTLKTGWDFDEDGKYGLGDVYRMVKLRLADPQDPRTDYNGDGRESVTDVVGFLLDILRGQVRQG